MTQNLREQLLGIADRFVELGGAASISVVGHRIWNDSRTLIRIRDGSDITTGNYERAMQYFSDNWPERKAWPAGVRRPAKTNND
jgi:hypothetical protein